MFTSLRATSLTIAQFLRQGFETSPALAPFFDAGSGGTMVVSLDAPPDMAENNAEGLSVWLYRVSRDEERLNAPPQRVSPTQLRRTPLPVRLHYLMTPVVGGQLTAAAEAEQAILGKVLQAFHTHPVLRGTDLRDDFSGTAVELTARLEQMSLEETARVWDTLDGSYQLSVSYEVSVVYVEAESELEQVTPVRVVVPEFGVIVSA